MSQLTLDHNIQLLPRLNEPASLWRYFLVCTETPRPSHNLDGFRKRLFAIAREHKCDVESDDAGNVVIRKAGVGTQSVCVQCHMDMVTSKNDDVSFDFAKQPILTDIVAADDGQHWLKARGTTLGADDGIGAAACLALLDEDSVALGLPPLELLFTADEETTMGGAENISASLLQSKIMINVDSEDENEICIGCAGGFEQTLHRPLSRSHIDRSESQSLVQCALVGFQGGHTGAQIHEYRAHPFKLAARILRNALIDTHTELSLVSFSGGTAVNSIPRECSFSFLIPSKSLPQFLTATEYHLNLIKQEYAASESEITLKTNTSSTSSDALPPFAVSPAESLSLLSFLTHVPHGVLRIHPTVPNLVELSCAFSIVELKEHEMFCHLFPRSSSNSLQDNVRHDIDSFATLSGCTASAPFNPFPGWQPDLSSAALAVVRSAFSCVNSPRLPHVYAVHAGLECGLIQKVYPEMDCVSIGPTVLGAHSPDERLHIESVPRFYQVLLESLKAFTKI